MHACVYWSSWSRVCVRNPVVNRASTLVCVLVLEAEFGSEFEFESEPPLDQAGREVNSSWIQATHSSGKAAR